MTKKKTGRKKAKRVTRKNSVSAETDPVAYYLSHIKNVVGSELDEDTKNEVLILVSRKLAIAHQRLDKGGE